MEHAHISQPTMLGLYWFDTLGTVRVGAVSYKPLAQWDRAMVIDPLLDVVWVPAHAFPGLALSDEFPKCDLYYLITAYGHERKNKMAFEAAAKSKARAVEPEDMDEQDTKPTRRAEPRKEEEEAASRDGDYDDGYDDDDSEEGELINAFEEIKDLTPGTYKFIVSAAEPRVKRDRVGDGFVSGFSLTLQSVKHPDTEPITAVIWLVIRSWDARAKRADMQARYGALQAKLGLKGRVLLNSKKEIYGEIAEVFEGLVGKTLTGELEEAPVYAKEGEEEQQNNNRWAPTKLVSLR